MTQPCYITRNNYYNANIYFGAATGIHRPPAIITPVVDENGKQTYKRLNKSIEPYYGVKAGAEFQKNETTFKINGMFGSIVDLEMAIGQNLQVSKNLSFNVSGGYEFRGDVFDKDVKLTQYSAEGEPNIVEERLTTSLQKYKGNLDVTFGNKNERCYIKPGVEIGFCEVGTSTVLEDIEARQEGFYFTPTIEAGVKLNKAKTTSLVFNADKYGGEIGLLFDIGK